MKTLQLLFGRRRAEPGRDLQQEIQWLKDLLRLTRPLVEELEPDKVLVRILDTAVDLTGAERGFLLIFRGADVIVEVARNFWRKDVPEPEVEISRHLAQRVRAEGRGFVVEDATEDAECREFFSVYALKLRSVLCVPLVFRGEVKGVLYLDNRFARGSFRDQDLTTLESFADLAAIALVNSGRFAAERRRKQDLEEEVAKSREDLLRARQALARTEKEVRLRYAYENVVSESPAMRRLLVQVDRIIPTSLPVVLEGPTGTGKERLARIIHESGARQGRSFLVLPCASLPPSLAEVELFGHGRGAYTGAGEARGGLLDEAHGGTLYLEGIDDLDLDSQALFLRVLESGEYRRVGETEARRADVRIIAGARRPLPELVGNGLFREDLYFRLKGVYLILPTLEERPEDLPIVLEQLCREEAPGMELTPRARKALLLRQWPGNLVELRNEIRRLATLGQGVVDLEDLAPAEPHPDADLKTAVQELEKRMILRSLRLHGGNLTRAAAMLGLSRLGLRKKLTRYGIQRSP